MPPRFGSLPPAGHASFKPSKPENNHENQIKPHPQRSPATARLEARAIGSRISVSGVRGYEIEVFSLTTGRRICKIAATESDYQLPDTFLPDTYVLRAIGGGESRVAKLSIE